jgi:hypothetical protein
VGARANFLPQKFFRTHIFEEKNLALGASKVDSGPNQIKSNPLTQTNPLSKSLHLKSMLPWAEPRCTVNPNVGDSQSEFWGLGSKWFKTYQESKRGSKRPSNIIKLCGSKPCTQKVGPQTLIS